MRLKESDKKFTLNITQQCENKIRWWCSKLPDNEWSGVLFYEYVGSFDNDNDKLIITAKDFIVLDIGNMGHTQFNENAEIINYKIDNNLLDCQDGLIHSHNKMNAFFSGEDSSTLINEGSDRNHFLSLIVNNNGKYVAAITRRMTCQYQCKNSSYKTFNDETINRQSDNVITMDYVEKFNLDINKPECDDKRYDELVKSGIRNGVNANIMQNLTPTPTTASAGLSQIAKPKEPTLFDNVVKNNFDNSYYNKYYKDEREPLSFYDATSLYGEDVAVALVRIISGDITCQYGDVDVNPDLDDLLKENKGLCYDYILLCLDELTANECESLQEAMQDLYDETEYTKYAKQTLATYIKRIKPNTNANGRTDK